MEKHLEKTNSEFEHQEMFTIGRPSDISSWTSYLIFIMEVILGIELIIGVVIIIAKYVMGHLYKLLN